MDPMHHAFYSSCDLSCNILIYRLFRHLLQGSLFFPGDLLDSRLWRPGGAGCMETVRRCGSDHGTSDVCVVGEFSFRHYQPVLQVTVAAFFGSKLIVFKFEVTLQRR